MKKALITGITGQDGSYLAELLLDKGYEVHGLKRRASSFNTQRIDRILEDRHEDNVKLFLHYGELTDSTNMIRLMQEIQPDEVYNLGAQSHVRISWECPEFTAETDALGTLRLLEAIRVNGLEKKTRFYQASTSELFGLVQEPIQSEKTPFYPRSPYGVAKLYAYWITINYRESFGMFASNGILFNHESPRRGENFVTRKITMAASRIALGLQNKLYLGNLNAKRDWGHAKDYVEKEVNIDIEWQGEGLDEKGINKADGCVIVEIDPLYFRPAEVELLLGDSTKARTQLGWKPTYDLKALCHEMIESDFEIAKKEKLLRDNGYSVPMPKDI